MTAWPNRCPRCMATRVTICTVLPEPVGCSTRTSSVVRQTSVTNRTWYARSFLIDSMLDDSGWDSFLLLDICADYATSYRRVKVITSAKKSNGSGVDLTIDSRPVCPAVTSYNA